MYDFRHSIYEQILLRSLWGNFINENFKKAVVLGVYEYFYYVISYKLQMMVSPPGVSVTNNILLTGVLN